MFSTYNSTNKWNICVPNPTRIRKYFQLNMMFIMEVKEGLFLEWTVVIQLENFRSQNAETGYNVNGSGVLLWVW
jgi:hypothetical protein